MICSGRWKGWLKIMSCSIPYTFLSVRKVSKEAGTVKELLKLFFVPLKEINLFSLHENFKQNFFFNAPLRTIFKHNSFKVRELKIFSRNLFEVVHNGKLIRISFKVRLVMETVITIYLRSICFSSLRGMIKEWKWNY